MEQKEIEKIVWRTNIKLERYDQLHSSEENKKQKEVKTWKQTTS